MRLFIYTFLFVTCLTGVFGNADTKADEGDDLEHEKKKWWVAEDKDGTQHFDAEELCSRNIRISARDGSPVNELVGRGFDPVTGQIKARTHDIGDDSVLRTNDVYAAEMAPMSNTIKPSDHEELSKLSPELFERTMQHLKEAGMKHCKNKIASYASDSRYKIEIV